MADPVLIAALNMHQKGRIIVLQEQASLMQQGSDIIQSALFSWKAMLHPLCQFIFFTGKRITLAYQRCL